MSARITINIGFYFQKEHYSQLQAYIPRTQAIKIPGLMIEQRQQNDSPQPYVPEAKGRQVKSQSKKQSDEELSDEEDNLPQNDMQLENEIDNQMEIEDDNEDDVDADPDQQNQVERALKELEEENYDSDDSSSDDDQDDIELSSMLSNQSPTKGYGANKTKRQKGETKDLIELPDRRPRKDKKVDEATQIIRREQKERKRKQYLKKQIEAQQKATLQKILNETGRKLRLREEKQIQDIIYRQQKTFKTLGDVPKIITLLDQNGKTIMTHKTPLFPPSMTTPKDMRMRQICKVCNNQSKYKLKGRDGFVCSLPCYKTVMSH